MTTSPSVALRLIADLSPDQDAALAATGEDPLEEDWGERTDAWILPSSSSESPSLPGLRGLQGMDSSSALNQFKAEEKH